MKRWLAVLLSVLLLTTSVWPVSASGSYNDDHFNWGEYACPHSHTIETAAVDSTCIIPGHGAYVRCADCRVLLSGSDAELPLGDHAYDNACDTDCNVCGEEREITHDYRDTEIVPDCENSGYTIHTCSVCGHTYVDGRVEALGHDYVPLSAEPPTCVADGFERFICQNCGDSYTETLPATGKHTYDYICDEICNVCGYVRDDAHMYTFMGTVEPTCGEDGSHGYKCWECGGYKYVIIPATGSHTYSGACDAVCNVCGQTREGVVQHDYRLTDTVEVTCTTDGKLTYSCSGCGDSYTETVAAPGHKYDIVITAPDCENGGYTTHTCSACGHSIVDNRVDALGHNYSAVVTAPTCENGGYTTYTCTACGDTYTADITAALGHNYMCEVTNATCTADGKKVYTCRNCGDSYTETIPAVGHDYSAVVTAPTCENGGYTTYTCTACGDTYTADTTAALGHRYDDDRDTDCSVCGHVREVMIVLPGDANGDGGVNNRDLALVQQYINKWHVNIDAEAADVNADGAVNNRDLALLQQYINKWDVVLK